jgi:hypothetical protein
MKARKYVGTPAESNLYGDMRSLSSPIDRDGALGVGDASSEPQPMPHQEHHEEEPPELE